MTYLLVVMGSSSLLYFCPMVTMKREHFWSKVSVSVTEYENEKEMNKFIACKLRRCVYVFVTTFVFICSLFYRQNYL